MGPRQKVSFSGIAIFVTVCLCGCASTHFPVVSEQQHQVAPNVLLAGELTETGISALAGREIMVIDLRTAEEGADIEAEQLGRAGIARAILPIGKELNRDQVAEFARLLEANGERPVIVHCMSGNRAGMLWAAHLIDAGVPLVEAQRAVSAVVTKAPASEAIEAYAEASRQ